MSAFNVRSMKGDKNKVGRGDRKGPSRSPSRGDMARPGERIQTIDFLLWLNLPIDHLQGQAFSQSAVTASIRYSEEAATTLASARGALPQGPGARAIRSPAASTTTYELPRKLLIDHGGSVFIDQRGGNMPLTVRLSFFFPFKISN